MRRTGRPFGSKTKPPVTIETGDLKKYIEDKSRSVYRVKDFSSNKEVDRQYLLGMLEIFKSQLEPDIIEGPVPHKTNTYRYTPRQMFDTIMFLFKYALENGQPITVTSICTFLKIENDPFWKLVRDGQEVKEFMFLKDCIKFVEMYNEFMLAKKQNPAGAIFALKNFGWKDKLEIEASATQGALTEDERAAAQKRIAEFSEIR